MKLKRLLKDLDVDVKGSREIEVTGLSSHSQFISPGTNHFAIGIVLGLLSQY